ncbi:MAG: TIGR04013 family B12-binding domain/radical SAM domain-containing protein [Myxococcota bacterium]|jgi:B12-binding domain/radical SAM domain protein
MKPIFIYRFEPSNRFSIAALLGSLHVGGLGERVETVIARSEHAALRAISPGRRVFVFFSIQTVDAERWAGELASLRRNSGGSFTAVAGGAHPTGDPESMFRLGFDLVFSGRAERSFRTFTRAVLDGATPGPGMVHEEEDPDWPGTLYISDVDGFFPVLELQRGCRNRCRFCQAPRLGAGPVAYRPLDTVREYLHRLKGRGISRIYFLTPSAFDYAPPGHTPESGVGALLRLCRDSGMRFVEYGIFPSEVRPAAVTAPFFDLLARHGSNRRVVIGAQSFSPRMLRVSQRGHTVRSIESTVKAASEKGFRAYVDVMFGMPGETAEDRRMTLEAMESLFFSHGARMQLHHYVPLAGTPWYHDDPEPIDDRCTGRIAWMERAGMTRGWWREGPEMVASIKRVRDGKTGTFVPP